MIEQPRPSQRARGDEGAALVEFSIVCVLLFLLLYGIIGFGLLMSYKQNLVQSAAEGARAGAVAPAGQAFAATQAAINSSVAAYDQSCGNGFLTCNISVDVDCAPPATEPDCVVVELRFEYAASPDAPNLPLVDAFLPDRLVASSTAEQNP